MNHKASYGQQKIDTAFSEMPGLKSLINDYGPGSPLRGISILTCVTPTPQTGAFLITLQKLGAKLAACSDNAYAADDDVVAHLSALGIDIFAKSNMTAEEYFLAMDNAIRKVQNQKIIHIADDGCDITRRIVDHKPELFPNIKVITEQTTCGINYLRNLYAANKLPVPAININHAFIKQRFDNTIGIQQSLIHALSTIGISVPGKRIAIFGYGAVGQGAAQALRNHGAQISIVETDLSKLAQAELEGYTPIDAASALRQSDICLTASGCSDVITGKMIDCYAKDKLVLGNIGHGTEEYDVAYLQQQGGPKAINEHIAAFTLQDGREVRSLCKGALVNFLAGGGNMARIMDITFTLTVLSHLEAATQKRLASGLHQLDKSFETKCAQRCFSHLVPLLYGLSHEQIQHLALAE